MYDKNSMVHAADRVDLRAGVTTYSCQVTSRVEMTNRVGSIGKEKAMQIANMGAWQCSGVRNLCWHVTAWPMDNCGPLGGLRALASALALSVHCMRRTCQLGVWHSDD
jgi:hypothetical protein